MTDFDSLDLRSFVRLKPFGHFGESTDWHVNKRITATNGESERSGVVLQRGDGREQWLIITTEGSDVDDVVLEGTDNHIAIDEAPEIETTANLLEELDND
mgnify:FL=1